MQAVVFRSHGDRDVIDYETVADPEVGPDEVRVDAKAGALNHLDVWTRRGLPGIGVVVVPDSEL